MFKKSITWVTTLLFGMFLCGTLYGVPWDGAAVKGLISDSLEYQDSLDKSQQFYDLRSPYPVDCKSESFEGVWLIYGETNLYTVRSEPQNGYEALVLKTLYINPTMGSGETPLPWYANYRMARFEIKIVSWDNGYPDVNTYLFNNNYDTTYVAGYIPFENLSGLYHRPLTEGWNDWVQLTGADRSASANYSAVIVNLNMEAIDSIQIWVAPYSGLPQIDSAYTGCRMVWGNLYFGGEYLLVPKKSDLYGRRLRVLARAYAPSKLLDARCFGLTLPKESGFVRMISNSWGSNWDVVMDDVADITNAVPWYASGIWKRNVYPNTRDNFVLEEDIAVYRTVPPIWTTLSADVAPLATYADFNAPSGYTLAQYKALIDPSVYLMNLTPIYFYNSTSPADSQFVCVPTNILTDNGNGTWRATFGPAAVPVGSDYGASYNVSSKPRYTLHSGDPVLLIAHAISRSTGGEDGPWRGGFYNYAGYSWAPAGGFMKTRSGADTWALDSVLADGTTTSRSSSQMRIYGEENYTVPMHFTDIARLFFYQLKDRRSLISTVDSTWNYSCGFAGSIAYYADDLLEGNAKYRPYSVYSQTWDVSVGDGYIEKVINATLPADWVTGVNSTTGTAYPSTGDVNFYPYNSTTITACAISRIFFPFATASGANPWIDTTVDGYTKVKDSLVFSWSTSNTVQVYNTASSFFQSPWWSDSTEIGIVSADQASMTTLVSTDWDNVGEVIQGRFRLSRHSGYELSNTSYTFAVEPYLRVTSVPIQDSVLVVGRDTKLAWRFIIADIGEIPPYNYGSNHYARITKFRFNGTTTGPPPKLTVYYHLVPTP